MNKNLNLILIAVAVFIAFIFLKIVVLKQPLEVVIPEKNNKSIESNFTIYFSGNYWIRMDMVSNSSVMVSFFNNRTNNIRFGKLEIFNNDKPYRTYFFKLDNINSSNHRIYIDKGFYKLKYTYLHDHKNIGSNIKLILDKGGFKNCCPSQLMFFLSLIVLLYCYVIFPFIVLWFFSKTF